MRADRIAGVVVTAAGITLALATAQISILADQPTLSARFFPYMLAIILTAGGIFLVLRPGDALLCNVTDKLLAPRCLAFAALFLAYALTFRFVDFRLGTWIFMLTAMWILGSRKWWELAVIPLSVSLVIYLLFRYGFTILLPIWT